MTNQLNLCGDKALGWLYYEALLTLNYWQSRKTVPEDKVVYWAAELTQIEEEKKRREADSSTTAAIG